MSPTPKFSCFGWLAPQRYCSQSPSFSCAIKSSRSFGWLMPQRVSVKGVRWADTAEVLGKGREAPTFRPRGAREVRRAAAAFIEMKTRIERAMEQRTAMLAGVSHDLRTVLTRFKLELALIKDSPEVDAMKKDTDEMARMLEAYLA